MNVNSLQANTKGQNHQMVKKLALPDQDMEVPDLQ